MYMRNLKRLALSAAAIALSIGSASTANAQATATVATNFATAAALSAAANTTMDFGTWVVDWQTGDSITLALTSLANGGAVPAPTPGGTLTNGSTIINTVAPASSGSVTVTSPTATNVEIEANVTTPPASPSLSLGTITYTDGVATNATVPTAFNGTTTVATSAGVATPVGIGATLTIGGAVAASSTFNTAVITVGFQY